MKMRNESFSIYHLCIKRRVQKEEAKLLTQFKEITDITGKEILKNKSFERLGRIGVVVFYMLQACWEFFRDIFTLWIDEGYHSAYVLKRALVEYYIELCFLLKGDTKEKAEEYYKAWRENRSPFCNSKKYNTVKKRAKAVGLLKLYETSYKSLCSFIHADFRGSIIARRTHKFIQDKPKFLLFTMEQYLDILETISEKLKINFSEKLKRLLKERLEYLREYISNHYKESELVRPDI